MAKITASDRVRRLIALLGKLQPGDIPLADLAAEVGTTPADLSADLETLSVCGVAPYYPDQMVDVFVEGDTVRVLAPLPAMRGPVRFSPAEATSLAAALSAAGFPSDDSLVARLMAAASASFDATETERTIRSAIAAHEPGVFEALASAIRDHAAVTIAYQKEGAAESADRVVEPLRLFADRGAWYLSAWCRDAESHRTFRVERVLSATRTGDTDAAHRDADGTAPVAFATEGLPVARLRFSPGEEFVEREWPGGRLDAAGESGDVIAEVPFGGMAWIARRVVARLGRVEVLSPSELRGAVADLAREELANT
ncbi:MAG: WYL domain-containing protein [Coriobacteriia bacterium]|nr:WYL domain-containing protein [Coriobacteriia bacterium]